MRPYFQRLGCFEECHRVVYRNAQPVWVAAEWEPLEDSRRLLGDCAENALVEREGVPFYYTFVSKTGSWS